MANPSPVSYSAATGEKVAGGRFVTALTLVTAFDAGNASPTLSTVTDPLSHAPIVTVDVFKESWRHLFWAVEGAKNKRPVFRMRRSTQSAQSALQPDWLPCFTQTPGDFESWERVNSLTLTAGSPAYLEFQPSEGMAHGRVYLATQPLGQQQDAPVLAAHLLAQYPGIASPTISASSTGVFATSPAETVNGRPVGGHPMYSIKLAWGGVTTDGQAKRKFVMLAGLHAAGEHTSWIVFRYFLDFLIESSDAAAAALRANFDFYLYFNMTPNGIDGGERRTSPRTNNDPNRVWSLGPSIVSEIDAAQTAIYADTGGAADVMLSWHGWSDATRLFLIGTHVDDYETATRGAALQAAIDLGAPIFGTTAVVITSFTYNTDAWWGFAKLGCRLAIDPEIQQYGSTALPTYKHIAESWAKTIAAVDAAGHFTSES